ncbi:unnamed protein product [Lactuca virosa]|uniref:Uncharacterized protein n=1 Tax=Lactuca virosa TaxID=75947 RepID=A0AAU9MYJ9_9ASTR|nr:unnamed protein product [Lactuca virosa]
MCSSTDNRILPKLEFNWRIVMTTIIGFLGSAAALSKCTLSLPHYQLGSSPSQAIRPSTLFDLSISTVFKQVEGIEEIYESFKVVVVQIGCSWAEMGVPLSNLTPSLLVSKLCLGTMSKIHCHSPSNSSTKHSTPESTSLILQKCIQCHIMQKHKEGAKNTLVAGLEKEKYLVKFKNILHVIYFIILFDSTATLFDHKSHWSHSF